MELPHNQRYEKHRVGCSQCKQVDDYKNRKSLDGKIRCDEGKRLVKLANKEIKLIGK